MKINLKANVGFRRANRGWLFNVCAPYPSIPKSVSEYRKPVFFKLRVVSDRGKIYALKCIYLLLGVPRIIRNKCKKKKKKAY